jgi:hypothetical protein
MTATVVPFPITRDFIRRHAARLAEAQPQTAEKILLHTVRVQLDAMARRGIAAELIAQEARALETAIRVELCRLTIFQGGAA